MAIACAGAGERCRFGWKQRCRWIHYYMGKPRRTSFLICLLCFEILDVWFAEIRRQNISSVRFREVDIGGERFRFQVTKTEDEKLLRQVKRLIKKGSSTLGGIRWTVQLIIGWKLWVGIMWVCRIDNWRKKWRAWEGKRPWSLPSNIIVFFPQSPISRNQSNLFLEENN